MDNQDFTDLLLAYGNGERQALDQIVPLVYEELRRLAHHIRMKERPNHTLQTTALVHEAFMRLADASRFACEDRAHFMALAAQVMRRVLIDYARSRKYRKRDGGNQAPLEENLAIEDEEITALIAIDEAMGKLSAFNKCAALVFELRYFGGFSNKEIAETMKVSEGRTAQYYRFAKDWFERELFGQEGASHARQSSKHS